ncbi:MAG: lipopolysaccharide core heptose(I) kinase RfaP [Pseudomonadota bacterium]
MTQTADHQPIDSTQTYLREDVRGVFTGDDLLEVAFNLPGEPFRDVKGRRTLRVELDGRFFFIKLHYGVGWPEILKNWSQFKRPVVGAENEYIVCRALAEVGIRAPVVAAYARSSQLAPYRRSFVLCDELSDHTNLEEVAAAWLKHPPSFQQVRGLLTSVALFARRYHQQGFIHRDFYLCHLLIHNRDLADLDVQPVELGVLDLHRARRFKQIPDRWLKRDLAALLFSSMDLQLSERAWLRFVRLYTNRPLREEFAERGAFWREVKARAEKLYRDGLKRGIVQGKYPL